MDKEKNKERNYGWLIPVFLNLLVLVIVRNIFQENSWDRAVMLAVAALGFPWFLYFVVGRMISHVATNRLRESPNGEDTDFV